MEQPDDGSFFRQDPHRSPHRRHQVQAPTPTEPPNFSPSPPPPSPSHPPRLALAAYVRVSSPPLSPLSPIPGRFGFSTRVPHPTFLDEGCARCHRPRRWWRRGVLPHHNPAPVQVARRMCSQVGERSRTLSGRRLDADDPEWYGGSLFLVRAPPPLAARVSEPSLINTYICCQLRVDPPVARADPSTKIR